MAKPKLMDLYLAHQGKMSDKCPHCGAKFPQPLKFCGECGKAMA